jgi:uncharacterized membrane protein YeaQ/YmgE (transglycosylase-associated protein family)
MFVNLLGWSVLGLIAGMIAGKMFKGNGDDPKLDLVIGVLGAVAGGVLGAVMGKAGVASFNVWALMMAAIGAGGILVAWHTVRSFTARG